MATLIPALGACLRRMTPGEKRLAERLEDKLDDDYLLWYDVPGGPQQLHPDFIVLHPSRGLLILEVKDFRLSTIVQADKEDWTILDAASSATPEAVFDLIASMTPLRRVTTPQEFADAVLFFLSPWARAVTGQNLIVDCGLVKG